MIIPNKHDGYRAGRRLYHFGGGGGGGEPAAPAAPAAPPPRMTSAAPPPQYTTYGSGDRTGSLVQSGNSFRPSTLDYSKPIYDPNYADNITGYQQSSQFYQPIYQSNYQNNNTGNAMGVSQYGQQPSYGGGGGGGGGNSLTPEIARNLMQRSMMGKAQTSEFDKYGGYDVVQSMYDRSGGNYDKPTQQSITQPSIQSMQFNPYTNSSSYSGGMPQIQSPFSYQQPAAQRTSSGPRQAIVGRSSQARGAPNVVARRAEGGITSLLDDYK